MKMINLKRFLSKRFGSEQYILKTKEPITLSDKPTKLAKFMERFFLLITILFIVLGSFSVVSPAQAQSTKAPGVVTVERLNEEELKNFKEAVRRKVKELEILIKKIGSKETDQKTAHKSIKAASDLFNEEASIQVSNKSKDKVKIFQPVDQYFWDLRALKYSDVEITFYDVAMISDFERGTDGSYYCTAIIYQHFKGSIGDDLVYEDKTEKRVNIKIEQKKNPFGWNWSVLLDDVEVVNTI